MPLLFLGGEGGGVDTQEMPHCNSEAGPFSTELDGTMNHTLVSPHVKINLYITAA